VKLQHSPLSISGSIKERKNGKGNSELLSSACVDTEKPDQMIIEFL